MFRQRSTEAIKQKARRGELIRTVAVGYLKTDDDRIGEGWYSLSCSTAGRLAEVTRAGLFLGLIPEKSYA